jgi:hypothetical protein
MPAGCCGGMGYANGKSGANALQSSPGRSLVMDRRQFFGDSVAGTLIRLVLLSVVVGVVFSALGITPANLIERLEHLIRNVMNMGVDALNWAFKYFLLGAVIVFPIWFLVRLFRKSPPKA